MMGFDAVSVKKPKYKFIICRCAEIEAIVAKAVVHVFFDKQSRVRRHPTQLEQNTFAGFRQPFTHNLLFFVYKNQVSVNGIDLFFLEITGN